MYIDPRTNIGGVPALEARELMRRIADRSVSCEFIASFLSVSEEDARQVAKALEDAGYLELSDDWPHQKNWYKTTLKGNSLALSSAAGPIKRATAERKLQEFLDRVGAINREEYYLYRVKKVILFGSYLTDAERINDIDIAIKLSPKHQPEEQSRRNAERIREAASKGRRFSNIVEIISWPQTEVMRFLKSRSRAISLHSTDDPILEQSSHRIIYED